MNNRNLIRFAMALAVLFALAIGITRAQVRTQPPLGQAGEFASVANPAGGK